MTDTHPCLPLILRVYNTHTHTHLGRFFYSTSRSASIRHTHTSSCVLEILFTDNTHIHTPMPTLDCLHKYIFLLHVYRSVFLARMRRYMQLAYLFHQCATSLLSRDGRIADCTVRHPGVERPFSSLLCFMLLLTGVCQLPEVLTFNSELWLVRPTLGASILRPYDFAPLFPIWAMQWVISCSLVSKYSA